MLDKKTVSQCISADYCRGWNDAVDAIPRWISVEEQPPVWPCVVYDGHNPPYTPKGCIAMLHDADGRVNWIPEISLDALMKGSMPKLHNFPITHWMPLPEPPKEE